MPATGSENSASPNPTSGLFLVPQHETELTGWIGTIIVLDLTSPFVVVGTLVECGARYLALAEADVHDLRDTSTTREQYVLGAARHGVSPNRRRVMISREQIVAIASLADVTLD